MTDEVKQGFIMRISQANKSRLVEIVYDMFLSYTREALAQDAKSESYHRAVSHARGCLSELIDSVHRESEAAELAANYYNLYRFAERQLILADLRRDPELLKEPLSIMQRLRDAWAEVAKQDKSAPLMKNTDVVYAGMTYGPGDVSVDSTAAGTNRGFYA
ncbi:MAG: flagellar protein FliS [Lachnospiraceae bacterium]|nr:flagellar protein FliS [Lachnospiraceae bacterium]